MKTMTTAQWEAMYAASLRHELTAKERTGHDITRLLVRRQQDLRPLRDWVTAGFPKEG